MRYRSRLGTSRATFLKDDDLATVHKEIAHALPSVDPTTIELSDKPSGPFQPFGSLHGSTISQTGMKHGDMLFLRFEELSRSDAVPSDASLIESSAHKLSGVQVDLPVSANRHKRSQKVEEWKTAKQLPVDDILEAQSGKISRPRDNKMCKHALKGMCDYCMPLERESIVYCKSNHRLIVLAFDSNYLEENKIKHSSFHSYLKKINSATNKPEHNASFIPPLVEHELAVDVHCTTGHAPWPDGICSKCQPSAITLQRQEYRMVDHLEFADPALIDAFLNFWRKSGSQRFGYLYGYYEVYDAVPLGQKAVVEAIYEPPQVCQADGIELLPWVDETEVDRTASACGLVKVGMIFTDLTDDGTGKGTVLPKRHLDSFYLSGLEAGLSSSFQKAYPNKTHWSASGKYGSKFVTAVVSGTTMGQIEISTYQISEQGVAMFAADIVEPSVDPNTILVCPESNRAYIPEVFFSKVNEYGRQVKQNAKPAFPMEYLLVTLTHGFPKVTSPRFLKTSFPIENRAAVGEFGDLKAIATQLNLGGETSISAISDFHLLLYLISLDILGTAEVSRLIQVATTRDPEIATQLISGDGWATLLAILSESGGTRLSKTSAKRAFADNGSVNRLTR